MSARKRRSTIWCEPLSDDGVAVILASDTLEETIGLCHTILVMRDGQITGRFDAPAGHKPAQVELLRHMV